VFLGPFGAFIQLRRPFANPVEEAWVGVAGPVAGLLATVAIHWAASRYDSTMMMKAAMVGYIIHLFNLIPAGILDGARIAALLGRWLWVPGCLVLCWYFCKFADWSWGNCIFFPLLLLPALYRAWEVLFGKGKTGAASRIPHKAVHYCCVLSVSLAVLLTCAIGLWRTSGSISEMESTKATQTSPATP
jgi:membrane-associated protease RseP (regulator of RpoE activity)